MAEVTASYIEGDRAAVCVREHRIVVDQPPDDTGPTPTELFVGSLASCIVFFAQRFLRRNGFEPDGLEVRCRYELSEDRPSRVASIDVDVTLPDGLPEKLALALPRVIDHCTVHESLRHEPEVRVRLEAA